MKESCNRESGGYCYFHPKEILVGVCPLCLNERLLIIAAKQGLNSKSPTTSSKRSYTITTKSKPSISSGLPKIFAFGSFLHRRDVRHRRRRKPDLHHEFVDFANDLDTTSTSLEDESFISIKFGDNGMPSWEKSTNTKVSKVTLEHCSSMSWVGQTLVKDNNALNNEGNIENNNDNNKSVVEHAKPGAAAMRWRKRIGQLLQVIRWRRTTKGNVGGESGKGEGVMKVGRNDTGWMMRALKMRTK